MESFITPLTLIRNRKRAVNCVEPLSFQIREIRTYGVRAIVLKMQRLTSSLIQPLAVGIIGAISQLLSPWIEIRVGTIDTLRFGHHYGATWIKILSQKKNDTLISSNRKVFDIWFPGFNNPNPLLLDKWRQLLRVWPPWVVGGGVPNRALEKSQRISRINMPTWREGMMLCREQQPLLGFTKQEKQFCDAWLRSKGLEGNEKFICLNVRDDAWLSHIYPSSSWSKNDYRDSDIADYVLACKSLVNLGFYVFRMGAKVRKAIPYKHQRIIDYATSDERGELLDLYLASNCYLMISTGSGIDTVSWINQIPTLFVNYEALSLKQMTGYPNYVIFKNFISKDEEYLTLSQIVNLQLDSMYDKDNFLIDKKIKIINNSPEEINEAVKEVIGCLENPHTNSRLEQLQSPILDIIKSQDPLTFEAHLVPKVCKSFLESNPHWKI